MARTASQSCVVGIHERVNFGKSFLEFLCTIGSSVAFPCPGGLYGWTVPLVPAFCWPQIGRRRVAQAWCGCCFCLPRRSSQHSPCKDGMQRMDVGRQRWTLDLACSTLEISAGRLPHFSTHPRHAARALKPSEQGVQCPPQLNSDSA